MTIDDLVPEAALVPPPGQPDRAAFQRWLMVIVGSIYPTFLYGDFPERWVDAKNDQAMLLQRTDEQRKMLWRYIEEQTRAGPWFLGQRFSALDLCVWVMRHWRPRRAWFAENCPTLDAAADSANTLPALSPVRDRNFA